MKVLEAVHRDEASGSKVITTKWVATSKGTPEKPHVRARWVAHEYTWMDGTDCEHCCSTLGLELVKGVLSHSAAGEKNKDYVVAVVDFRRASFPCRASPEDFRRTA